MKLLLTIIASTFIFTSCAHHHQSKEHHHHKSCDKSCKIFHEEGEMFDMHCAQSVSEGDLHVKGRAEYKFDHGGQIYYFSTKKKLESFKKNIELNTINAKRNWEVGSLRR